MDIRSRLSRSVPALVEFDAAVPGGAQTRLIPPPKDFTLSAPQRLTSAMQRLAATIANAPVRSNPPRYPVITGTNQLISVNQCVERTSQQDQ